MGKSFLPVIVLCVLRSGSAKLEARASTLPWSPRFTLLESCWIRLEFILPELCILTMSQKRALQQHPFSRNVGHLEETKVKSPLDHMSPLGSCDFQTQMQLLAHRYRPAFSIKETLASSRSQV